MGPGRFTRQHLRFRRFYGNDPGFGFFFFQIATGACNGAAGSHTGDQQIHFPFCIAPDFGSGCFVMCFRIGGIVKLPGNKAAGILSGQTLGFLDRPAHAGRSVGEYNFRAVCRQQTSSFHTHGFGHGEYHAIASGRSQSRQCNAGVSAGGFDQDCTLVQISFFFGIIQHGFCNTVFDTAGRISAFHFAVYSRLQSMCLFQVLQAHQGRIPYEIADILMHLSYSPCF